MNLLLRALLGACLASATVATLAMGGAPETPPAAAATADFEAGRKAVEARDWPGALRALNRAVQRDERNADIHNYLGYAYRNSGKLDEAFRHYDRALALNPGHKAAHEYVGEAWLMVGNLPRAQEHLEALKRLCTRPCEELEELQEKIDAYQAKGEAISKH